MQPRKLNRMYIVSLKIVLYVFISLLFYLEYSAMILTRNSITF